MLQASVYHIRKTQGNTIVTLGRPILRTLREAKIRPEVIEEGNLACKPSCRDCNSI